MKPEQTRTKSPIDLNELRAKRDDPEYMARVEALRREFLRGFTDPNAYERGRAAYIELMLFKQRAGIPCEETLIGRLHDALADRQYGVVDRSMAIPLLICHLDARRAVALTGPQNSDKTGLRGEIYLLGTSVHHLDSRDQIGRPDIIVGYNIDDILRRAGGDIDVMFVHSPIEARHARFVGRNPRQAYDLPAGVRELEQRALSEMDLYDSVLVGLPKANHMITERR